jgi:uncharacterized protein (TIGR03435 family)
MTRAVAVSIAAVVLGASGAAQQPTPRFEVASIKRVESPRPSLAPIPRALPGGQFRADMATVDSLLWFAYGVRQDLVVGGPDWARRDRFEISARAETEVPADQIKLMVRSLLEDRFRLAVHVEPREMRYQALVRARPDGSPGPGLERLDECSPAVVIELRRKFPEKYPMPTAGAISACSSKGLGDLATLLTMGLGTPVIDASGLTDSYYFTIRSQFSPAAALTGRTFDDPNLPALSTALDEQLGLKLESRRGPVDVLVIDSVQEPTEN